MRVAQGIQTLVLQFLISPGATLLIGIGILHFEHEIGITRKTKQTESGKSQAFEGVFGSTEAGIWEAIYVWQAIFPRLTSLTDRLAPFVYLTRLDVLSPVGATQDDDHTPPTPRIKLIFLVFLFGAQNRQKTCKEQGHV